MENKEQPFNRLLDIVGKYVSMEDYVYTVLNKRYAVVLQKCPNYDQEMVSACSEFDLQIKEIDMRALRVVNKLVVVKIVDLEDLDELVLRVTVKSNHPEENTTYILGQILKATECYRYHTGCKGCICHYINLETAYHNDAKVPENFTGTWKTWYIGGRQRTKCEYLNGKLNGPSLTYYDYNDLWKEEHYKNGVLHGAFKAYHMDGSISREGEYNDGVEVSCRYSPGPLF